MEDILSDYILKKNIGEGTFGIVKLAIKKSTTEKVAIKILEKDKMTSEDDIERVRREIDILQRMHHINIIKIIDLKEDEEKLYIIMEFCEKGELFNLIVNKQFLEEKEASYFYYQLINGLDCIHKQNIVHRDLKPENLLISSDNILKIIDFGLSNEFYPNNLLETPCGSPCYASPEMVSGNKYDGFKIDIWSTGIILYAMLCGYLPFDDQDNEILFEKIIKCEYDFPSNLSIDAIDLLSKILVNDPEKRIKLSEIKKHIFYKRGKYYFQRLHPTLVHEVENISNKNDDKKLKKNENKNEDNSDISEEISINIENENKSEGKESIKIKEKCKSSTKDNKSIVKYKKVNLTSEKRKKTVKKIKNNKSKRKAKSKQKSACKIKEEEIPNIKNEIVEKVEKKEDVQNTNKININKIKNEEKADDNIEFNKMEIQKENGNEIEMNEENDKKDKNENENNQNNADILDEKKVKEEFKEDNKENKENNENIKKENNKENIKNDMKENIKEIKNEDNKNVSKEESGGKNNEKINKEEKEEITKEIPNYEEKNVKERSTKKKPTIIFKKRMLKKGVLKETSNR